MTLAKRALEVGEFARLAAVERDAFTVLAQPHQREAEIRLEALLVEIERDQRLADHVREPSADDCIDQRDPDHVPGNLEAGDFQRARERP